MSKHTPEPWHTGGKFEGIIYDIDGNAVGNTITYHGRHGIEAGVNARRIVACVNACAGIDTEWLENHNAALADIAAVVAAYNESKSSPMTTKLRLAIEKLERGFARAEVQS